jgi:hypothetical protein
MAMKRKTILEVLDGNIKEMLMGDIDEVIENLQNMKKDHPEHKLSIDQDGWGDNVSWQLMGERLETDKELERRLISNRQIFRKAKIAKRREKDRLRSEKAKEERRKMFERLKKEFE